MCALYSVLTEAVHCGFQQRVVVNHSVRSTLDNDIHDSQVGCNYIAIVQYLGAGIRAVSS